MERYVVRETRIGVDYPQGNQMMAFPAIAGGSNMISPETIYFGGPFASEFPNVQRVNTSAISPLNQQHNINGQHNMSAQHNKSGQQNLSAPHNMNVQQNMNAQHNMSAQHNMRAQQNLNTQHNMNAQHNISVQHNNTSAQHNTCAQYNMNAHHDMSAQHNMNVQHNINAQHTRHMVQNNMSAQHNMNPQMEQAQGFIPNPVQGHVSGIDPRYLAGYNDNSAQYIIGGQQIQRNTTSINSSFSNEYQNRSFKGVDRNKPKSLSPRIISTESPKVEAMPKLQKMFGQDNKNDQKLQQKSSMPLLKKPNELDLLRNDIQNQTMTRADKLKALHKSGPRAFSGPVEKVLKWHKSLQDIGILCFFEIVAKCVSVRPGESCSKNLVVRDDNGPAMQVVYYEIDFLLPELKLPCTIRVIGRMMAGTSRLQAFNVRPATGDDVATLPRRAAVAAHHVSKLCKEYGPNA